VLITGGAGFIGSHLAEALLDQGCQVTIIDDLSTGCFENIRHLAERRAPEFRFAIDSITNATVLDRLASECDVVYHLAAAVGVKLIVEHPVHTIETNVMGTEAVLNAAVRYRAKVLVASTSEVYGKGNHLPFAEGDDVTLGPTSRSRWAYAASKMVDEFLALAYHRERSLPVVVVRLFNTVGPRQTGQYGMVLPRFVQQALCNEPLTVYGDGQQSRCFCNVHDVVRALSMLPSCQGAVGEVFNIGTDENVTILNLARRVLAMVDADAGRTPVAPDARDERIVFVPYEEAYSAGFEDMRRRVPSTAKITALLGWQPAINLDQTLREVIDYYKSVGCTNGALEINGMKENGQP
jgi:UDP-glucose 4-epimerase